MNLQLDAPVLALETGQLLSLDNACGTSIHPRTGTLWITEEGEPRDFVVGPGEAFLVRRPGRTLVQAMAPARVELSREEDLPCAANENGDSTLQWVPSPSSTRRSSSIASP